MRRFVPGLWANLWTPTTGAGSRTSTLRCGQWADSEEPLGRVLELERGVVLEGRAIVAVAKDPLRDLGRDSLASEVRRKRRAHGMEVDHAATCSDNRRVACSRTLSALASATPSRYSVSRDSMSHAMRSATRLSVVPEERSQRRPVWSKSRTIQCPDFFRKRVAMSARASHLAWGDPAFERASRVSNAASESKERDFAATRKFPKVPLPHFQQAGSFRRCC